MIAIKKLICYNKYMDKVVLITGGSKGIGEQIVKEFAKANYKVIFTYYTNQTKANNLVKLLKNYNVECCYLDVKDYDMCKKLIQNIVLKHKKIDCLVNNAGISLYKLAMDCSESDFDLIMNTNFKGVFNMTSNILPFMAENNFGRIINISSIWGQTGASCESLYSASKGAVDSFTKSIAKEMASKNITTNAISPGMIDTEMNNNLSTEEIDLFINEIPVHRQGKPVEIAKLCLYLAEDSGYINGQIIGVNGGLN